MFECRKWRLVDYLGELHVYDLIPGIIADLGEDLFGVLPEVGGGHTQLAGCLAQLDGKADVVELALVGVVKLGDELVFEDVGVVDDLGVLAKAGPREACRIEGRSPMVNGLLGEAGL